MHEGYLATREAGGETRVAFARVLPRDDHYASHVRVSPIFSADARAADPDLSNGSILFLVFERPYQTVARIRTTLGDLFARTWFSHGLASVVLFNATVDDVASLAADHSLGFRAAERWVITEGVVTQEETHFAPAAAVEKNQFEVMEYDTLDADSRILLQEFEMCSRTAIALAAQFAPRHLRVFTALTSAVNELIHEMRYLEAPSGAAPESLPEGMWNGSAIVRSELQRRLHQRIGQLVQINSAFSYVISQLFTGTFPLKRSECQIRRHSLLGVGTAVNALAAFSRFVERIFGEHPIDEAVDQLYDLPKGVPIWPAISADFDPRLWRDDRVHIDTFLDRMPTVQNEPRLAFFSGRLGFREAEFSVTAALQVLAAGDSTRWSMMTLSHELMHAHVRALLSVVFDEHNQDAPTSFDAYYRDLQDIFLERRSDTDLSLRASIRSAILNFATVRPWLDDIAAHRSTDISIKLLPQKELKEALAHEFGYINHIFVHVFDFHYFYDAKSIVYLRLLWESWATVPAVLEDIAEYVLRSVVTVSTAQEGTTFERLELALAVVRQVLELLASGGNRPIAEAALSYINDPESKRWLSLMFVPSSYLAELGAELLVSSRIHAALLRDNNADPDEYGCSYVLESGEFVETDIESPVAFVLDRLRRHLIATEGRDAKEEYYSAWSLLVCASALP